MKKNIALILAVCLALLMCACMPSDYSARSEKEYLTRGTELIEEYLKNTYGDYTLGNVTVIDGQNVSSESAPGYMRSLSNVVGTTFASNGHKYGLYVDISNGSFYSNDYSRSMYAAVEEYLESKFLEAGMEIDIYVYRLSEVISIVSENIPTKENETISTVVDLYNVLPTDVNETDIIEYLSGESVRGVSFVGFSDAKISDEVWYSLKNSCPFINQLVVDIVDTEALNNIIKNDRIDAEDFLTVQGRYVLNDAYEYDTYGLSSYNDIYVIYIDRIYSKESINDESAEYKMTTTFTESDTSITVETNNQDRSYILFKGGDNYGDKKIGLLNTMLSEDNDPTYYSLVPYADYYTIDCYDNFEPYYFTNKIKIAK